MATFTALAKIYSTKHFCNTRYLGLAKFLSSENFQLYGIIGSIHVCPYGTFVLFFFIPQKASASYIPMFFCPIAGCKNSATCNMEQRLPTVLQVNNQQVSVPSEHSAPMLSSNQFDSTTINTGHYMPSQVSGSLLPSTISQQILSSPQQHSSLGPSGLPSQLG